MRPSALAYFGSILVVDDDPESLALLTRLLAAEGYRVFPADSGQMALASLEIQAPQLILLDARMPGLDGFEVCRRIKSDLKSRDIPLMFISAATDIDERVEGLRLGAVDFITKPYRREDLLARIGTHLELGRLRNELEGQVTKRTAELSLTIELLQREIGERRRAEQTLSESEERFQNMADTAPVMIWVSGPDMLCTFFSKWWLTFTGRTLEQEIGNGWADGVHPDDRGRCLATYSSSFAARYNFQMEYRMRRADGEYRWVLNSGVPRFEPSGGFAGYIGSCIDITDIKRTHDEKLHRQKLESVGTLASGIAHDFNNLLGCVLSDAELALSEIADCSSPVEELQRICAVAIRGAEIVRQLMIYSGKESPAFEPVDVPPLVGEMLQLLKASIPKHAILETDLGQHVPLVHGNAPQIRQVVMNLVRNASEAIGEEGGLISIVTSAANSSAGDFLRLQVSDTGAGMSPETIAKVFDPFFTTKLAGHGLGLAVVQAIVRSHGGEISVASAVGKGTTFEILLPGARTGDTGTATRNAAECPPASGAVFSASATYSC